MKEFFETTLGRVILGVIVAIIWGVNMISFSEMSSGGEMQTVQQVQHLDMDQLELPRNVTYSYKAVRDPFASPNLRASANAPVTKNIQDEAEFIAPTLTLNGIFDGMAVISDEVGQSFFVEEGDVFKDDIKVKEIVQDSVILEYQESKFTLKLK
jgi:type II secretory pathway component PulC